MHQWICLPSVKISLLSSPGKRRYFKEPNRQKMLYWRSIIDFSEFRGSGSNNKVEAVGRQLPPTEPELLVMNTYYHLSAAAAQY